MTNANATMIHVGVSPSGVEWNVYKGDGETFIEMSARAAQQRARLDTLHARIAAKRATVIVRVKLTQAQAAYCAEAVEFDDNNPAKVGGRWIEGTRAQLADVAHYLVESCDEWANNAAANVWSGGNHGVSVANELFAERQTAACIMRAVRKLRGS